MRTAITGQKAEKELFWENGCRKHLTTREVEKLLDATRGGRHAARDRYPLFLMFCHGLRVSEACALKMSRVDVEGRVLHVVRIRKRLATTHPPHTEELRLIKAWMIDRARMRPACSAFFVSQKRHPLNRRSAWLAWIFRRTPTSSGTPAASPRPTKVRTHGLFRIIWGTGIFGILSFIRRQTRPGLKDCGDEE